MKKFCGFAAVCVVALLGFGASSASAQVIDRDVNLAPLPVTGRVTVDTDQLLVSALLKLCVTPASLGLDRTCVVV